MEMKMAAFLAALVLIFSMVSLSVYAEDMDTAGDAPTEQPVENPEDTTTETQQSSEERVDEEPAEATETAGEPTSLEDQEGGVGTLGGGGEGGYLPEPVVTPKSPIDQKGFFQTSLLTGGASYTYLLEVPPGTNRLSPTVTLSYTSLTAKGRAGWVGLGWDLSPCHVQRDVNHTPDDLDDEFNLILNGRRYDLIYVESEDRYHTQTESYLYVEKKSDSMDNEKGEYWLVKTKDGIKYRFGYRSDSETISSVRDYVWRWSLDEIEDTHGNHIYYHYSENPAPEDMGTVYLDRIEYNNNRERIIQFVLENTNRPDIIPVYEQGSRIEQTQRLKEIRVSVDGALVRKYILNYSMNQVSTRSLLSSVTEYGADNFSFLSSTDFRYKEMISGWQEDSSLLPPTRLNSELGVRIADVNGDGLPDILKGYYTEENERFYSAMHG